METAKALRATLSREAHVDALDFVDASTFPGLITFPLISTISLGRSSVATAVAHRDGSLSHAHLPTDGGSWNAALNSMSSTRNQMTLGDLCIRISCGVATGADGVFVIKTQDVPPDLLPFAYPTVAGRELGVGTLSPSSSMLIPYDKKGVLLKERSVKPLGDFLRERGDVAALQSRTCVRDGRPWYRFHDNVPLPDMLQPKIIWKDIAREPRFWKEDGKIVPRHTVYYAVPKPGVSLDALVTYLNSTEASDWIKGHAQRAHGGFYRLQSRVLRDLPVPDDLAAHAPRQTSLFQHTR